MITIFRGTIVHTKSFDEFESFEQGFVAVNADGKIIGVGGDAEEWQKRRCIKSKFLSEVRLTEFQFLMPGLVDCHIHAPQYAQVGLGLDMPLLDWLNTYTFPLEAKFTDSDFALEVYTAVVKATIKCGTTLASYFGTNNLESTLILANEVKRQGQRALIGKVCSNCNSPSYYVETTEESVKGTELFVAAIMGMNSPLILPTITPRFALSCSEELLQKLGHIAQSMDLHVQSHISENLDEINVVKGIFNRDYASVYDKTGLLGNKTVLAHGVHLEDSEIALIRERGAAIAHCPASNTMLGSGICDVQRLVKAGVTVGLGTDVSGGNSVSIQDTILRALDLSKHLDFFKKQDICGSGSAAKHDACYKPLKYKQALYLATLGGAKALALGDITGNFEEGKDFDACLIDMSAEGKPHRLLNVDELVEKFLFTGNDRNILSVFVAGQRIKGGCE